MSFQCVVYDKKLRFLILVQCVLFTIKKKKNPHALFFFSYILEAERRDPNVMEKSATKVLIFFHLTDSIFLFFKYSSLNIAISSSLRFIILSISLRPNSLKRAAFHGQGLPAVFWLCRVCCHFCLIPSFQIIFHHSN